MTTKQKCDKFATIAHVAGASAGVSIPQGQIIVIRNKICMHEYGLAYAQLDARGIGENPDRTAHSQRRGNCNAETIAYLTGQSLFLCERHSAGY